jgi:mono/diheme cytochrome c family protein
MSRGSKRFRATFASCKIAAELRSATSASVARRLLGVLASAIVVIVAAGCVQEMANQPRLEPLEASSVFEDGRSSRQQIEGTIARGQLQLDTEFFTGRRGEGFVAELPRRALDGRTMAELLERGHDRFGVYCSHCHGLIGGGSGGTPEMEQAVGMVVKRGFPMPQTYHQDRLRQMPLGYFFDVINNGFGRMPAHGYMVTPEDRWAIAAYIRALQLSQYATSQQLSPEDLQKLNAEPAAPSASESTSEPHDG